MRRKLSPEGEKRLLKPDPPEFFCCFVEIQKMKILFLISGVPEHVFQRVPAIPSDMLMPCDSLSQNQKDGIEIIHCVGRRTYNHAFFGQNIPKRE
jgi:hypothetical protein